MKNKNIVKEIKSYSAIFLFFILIFTYCSNNMTFAASYCSDYGVDESINKFQRCRENSIKEDINNASNYLDIDGNLPITCGDVDVPFNPYKEDGDDYYYDSKNTACLAGALTINISLSVTSIAAGLACGGVQVIDKAIKDGHGWRAAYEIVDQIINGAAGIAEGAVIGTVADPLITIPAQAGGTAAQLILLGISTTNWACVGIAGGIATGILVAYYAYIGTQQLLEKEYINDIKTCGYDWNTYAYTQYDMEAPSIEWYPQYGSFSNSYSYKLDKIITGEYNCDEFITFSGNDKKSYSENSNATACSNQASSCKAALRECMANQTNDVNPNLSLCIQSYDDRCTESCAKYYAICEPMLSTLDGDGYCVNPSDDDKFCKDIFSYSKNIKNRYYREALYRGKEYKISTTYYGEEDACIDPRTNEQKGYSGLEQRYYFKGKEAAQYACGRFQYKGGGCILADGSFSNNEIECRQAFEDAKTCCENRRALGICIYDSENNDRNNNTMCLRSGSSDSDPETCTLDVGTIKPKFKAYQSQYNSIDICIRSDNFCPYDFNLSGGTELQQLYCDGEYLDYGCSDYYKIWRKGAINYPTQSYGQIKNFCFYRAHCTEMGESDYAFPEMTSSKYLPQACSDFIGDSRNLPEPLLESENSSKDNVNLKMFRGFTAPMAQCIRETIYNMFHNIAGRSICMDGSTPNDDGYCSTDTEKSLTDFKEGKAITEENFPEQYDRYNKYSSYNDYITSTYAMIIGEQLEESENIFYNIQKNVQLLIKLAAAIAIIVIGITFLMKGDLDIFGDPKKPKAMIVGMLKFAIVFYFAVGDAWQSQFYDWIDKSTQYLYYKAFDLSLVGYKDYRSLSFSGYCDNQLTECATIVEDLNRCEDFNYTGSEQTFTVPEYVDNVTLEVWGAQGGNGKYSTGGLGGYSTGKLAVQQNDVLKIIVGGAGGSSGAAGYNGGGKGNEAGGGGGGRTEILSADNTLLIVAGGGGGGSEFIDFNGGAGGGGSNSGGSGSENSTCAGAGGANGIGGGSSESCNTADSKYGKGGSVNGGDFYFNTESGTISNDGKTIETTKTVNIGYSSSLQNITVPDNAVSAVITIYGAAGGKYNGSKYKYNGGKGGKVTATLAITSDIKTISIGTGSVGESTNGTSLTTGGSASQCGCKGGDGGHNNNNYIGAAGGGCSCVIVNGNKIMIAGGGGGASRGGAGGTGGGIIGGNGDGGKATPGGSNTSKGQCTFDNPSCGTEQGDGCDGQSYKKEGQGGGGGGGYYGGAGGKGAGSASSAGGGGGSGYVNTSILTNTSMVNGLNDGNGYATIEFHIVYTTDSSSGTGGGGAGYGGGASGSSGNSGGGGGGYVNKTILTETSGVTGSNEATGNGKARICYTLNRQPETSRICQMGNSTREQIKDPASFFNNVKEREFDENGFPVMEIDANAPNVALDSEHSLPIDNAVICTKQTNNGTISDVCNIYSNCAYEQDEQRGEAVYEFSETYDGCYFGDSKYPAGKEYLAIFDSLDCKLANYFSYGPRADLPGILHMLLLSLIWSPLALITVLCGIVIFIILLAIVFDVLYIFLMSTIAINLLIYVSPIIFPMLLFKKYSKIFTNWLDALLSFCLQFVFVIIFAGFLVGNLDTLALGSAKYINHDPTTGRLPELLCEGATDSIMCLFAVNTQRGTKPLMGEKVYKFLGLGPIVNVINSITQDFKGTLFAMFKFCLIIYVLMEFLKKMPEVARQLTNGAVALTGKNMSVTETLGKVAGGVGVARRAAAGLIRKTGNGIIKTGKDVVGGIKNAKANREQSQQALDNRAGKLENKGDSNKSGGDKIKSVKQSNGSSNN